MERNGEEGQNRDGPQSSLHNDCGHVADSRMIRNYEIELPLGDASKSRNDYLNIKQEIDARRSFRKKIK